MLPQSYKFSHGLCLNNSLQVLLIDNQRYQAPPFIYINQDDEVSHLVRVRKELGDMKYLMRSVKQAVEAVVIWNEEKWDMKRVNSLYTNTRSTKQCTYQKQDSLVTSLSKSTTCHLIPKGLG